MSSRGSKPLNEIIMTIRCKPMKPKYSERQNADRASATQTVRSINSLLPISGRVNNHTQTEINPVARVSNSLTTSTDKLSAAFAGLSKLLVGNSSSGGGITSQ